MKRSFELVAEIQEKDAEIDAMAKLAVLLKEDLAKKDAEIERLKKRLEDFGQKETYKEWQRNQAEIERLKALCARAADALEHESWVSKEQCGLPSQFVELIAELRKAAE